MNNHLKNNFFNIKGREIELPFNVTIESRDQSFEVTATKIFKIAPKKRLVCAGICDEKPIVMKFFFESIRANHYFKKELRGLKALKRSGVRTPAIVFAGKVKNSKIKMIATEEVLPASDMMSVWNNTEKMSVYADLQKKIMQKIAVMHNAGIKQDDLHLGNFLVSDNRIYTIDGDGVDIKHKGKPLREELSLENLSVLFGQFYPRLDKLVSDSLRFYAECRGWPIDTKSCNRLFTRLKPRIQKIRAIKLKKYLKKVFRECSEFVSKKSHDMEMVCDRKTYNSGLKKFINDPEFYIKNGSALKSGNSSKIIQIDIDNTLYVVKTYNLSTCFPFSEKYLKKTRARISWRNAHLMKQLGHTLPTPFLFMEERRGYLCLNAYFVVKSISQYEPENYSKIFQMLESNNLNLEQEGF
jgi:serine/threonine-protein kinase RIO1